MPWWLVKALVQKALSGMPGGNRINYALQRLSGTRHQASVDARVPRLLGFLESVNGARPIAGAEVLEIGSGWNAINAILLSLIGAKRVVSVDHVPHLRLREIDKVLHAVRLHAALIARASGRPEAVLLREIGELGNASSLQELLREARIEYRAPADACRMPDADGSFDIVYGYAVLAHVPEPLLAPLAVESKRLLRAGGIVAHRIGLQDPYNTWRNGDNVGFLAYDDRTWAWLDSAIQSNNRLRASEHARKYTDAGGSLLLSRLHVDAADVARVQRMKVASRFAGLAQDDLAAHALDLVCRFQSR